MARWFAVALMFAALTTLTSAQDNKPASEVSLEDQVIELRSMVAKLQAALGKDHQGSATKSDSAQDHASHGKAGMKAGMKMGMGKSMEGMKMGMDAMKMGMKMGEEGMKGGMDMAKMGMKMGEDGRAMGMAMMKRGMGKEHMHKMGKTPNASLGVSALPGFPGASHIYHIGSTGFFLDHMNDLKLTTEQQQKLNGIKEKALAEQSEFDRQIEKAEEELWSLTGSDSPDAAAIEKGLQSIGSLSAEQRLSFIRAVGTAAELLNDEQRAILSGSAKPDAHAH